MDCSYMYSYIRLTSSDSRCCTISNTFNNDTSVFYYVNLNNRTLYDLFITIIIKLNLSTNLICTYGRIYVITYINTLRYV